MLEKIRYIEIEVLNKTNKTDIKTGLLSGLSSKNITSFIRLALNGTSSIYCSMDFYTIVSILIVKKKTSKQDFYKNDLLAQTEAMGFIRTKLDDLVACGIADNMGNIDLSKYEDVPLKYISMNKRLNEFDKQIDTVIKNVGVTKPVVTEPAITVKPNTVNTATNTINNVAVNRVNNRNLPIVPAKSMSYMNRHTKKPSTAFLKTMKKKITDIALGIHKPLVILAPDIEEDTDIADTLDVLNTLNDEADKKELELDDWPPEYGYMM